MQLTQVEDSNALLTYTLMTTPTPVQVSPSQTDPSYLSLTVVASNMQEGDVYVEKLVITLPVGDPQQPDSLDLTEQGTGMRPSVSPSADWNTPASPAPGVFVFTPINSPLLIDAQGYAFNISNIQASTVVGTATIEIDETASAPPDYPQDVRNCYLNVSKFPYGFYAGNFTATQPLVQNGQPATLSWVGSENATYTMLWSTQSQNVSNVRQWSSPPLTDTTTFILQVQAQQGGQTVTLYFSVTVIVADPNITAQQLTVLQTSTLRGALNVYGKTTLPTTGTGPLTASSIHSTGALTASSIRSTGALSCDGTLECSGILEATGKCYLGYDSGSSRALNYVYGVTYFEGFAQVNTSRDMPAFQTRTTITAKPYCLGIFAQVVSSKDWGVGSNGRISSSAGSAPFTHLPTSSGHRVVTSPLTLESEVHFSGHARLHEGRSSVQFDAGVSELISGSAAYKVLLTPTGHCRGLCVVNKERSGFIVEELNDGRGDASFDWYVVARKARSLEDDTAEEMPDALPDIAPPTEPSDAGGGDVDG